MGKLVGRRINYIRNYLDETRPIPTQDYEYEYPRTVYEAINRTMDDNSVTLDDEIEAIYRLINEKQDIIQPGNAGHLMTWTGMRGQIGDVEIVRSINPEPMKRSHTKVPSERAIGDQLDQKVDFINFNQHVRDGSMHLTDVERTRWNAMAPLSSLQAHISNTTMHITDAERELWNSKADQTNFDSHIYDINNPHHVTAHQVGTYTREEVDDMFQHLRESFFNYLNIEYDNRTNVGELKEYHPANWNPNYILEYGQDLPDVPDPSLTYFALKPATDYQVEETPDCIIYRKAPGLVWQEVGIQQMSAGDMVIQFPNTIMYVWIQGRFVKLFSGNSSSEMGSGTSTVSWRPIYNKETGELSWVQSDDKTPPEPMEIKGKDGYTPIKGIDYVDGVDGKGVPVGGQAGDVLVKVTDENYDTTWKNLVDVFSDLILKGDHLPEGILDWDSIKGKPEILDGLGDSSFDLMSQAAITKQFEIVSNNIAQILEKLNGVNGIDAVREELFDHINDFNNPHRVTPAQIGAVSNATFTDHTQNYGNPHNVTAEQLGLGKVDNTSDLEKPISNATKEALDKIIETVNGINADVDNINYISSVSWDDAECILTFTYRDGTPLEVHIPIDDVFNSLYYDETNEELVFVLPGGNEHRIDVSKMLQKYFGSLSENIQVEVTEDHVIKATVVPGSIGELEIAPSVHLRNSPTTTTQPTTDKSTRIATTEFVKNQVLDNLISYETDRPLSANMGRILNQRKADIEDVINIINDLEGIDVIDTLDSTNPDAALSANMGRYLDLTKAPRVHTSPSGATYGRATISLFGHTRASDVDPLMDGTVFRGTDDGYYARADHRHPTDTTRAPQHWPDVGHNQYEMTGEPRAVIPPDNSNDNRIATTEWVRRNAVGVVKGYCYTKGNDARKTAVLRSTYMDPVVFIRQIGSTVSITFANEDNSKGRSNPTYLNVNDTGDAKIIYAGKSLTDGMLGKNYEHMFVFDGLYWKLINPVPGADRPDIDIGPSGGGEEPDIPIEPDLPRNIIITFNPTGGSVTPNKTSIKSNTAVGTLPTPSMSGYIFEGWYTEINKGGSKVTNSSTFDRDSTIYAAWKKDNSETPEPEEPERDITIIFNPTGGDVFPVNTVIKSGSPIGTLPTPSMSGYIFEGWYTEINKGGSKVTNSSTFDRDSTIYAAWIKDDTHQIYNITLDAQGGTIGSSIISTDLNGRVTTIPDPIREGYLFNGWYTKPSGKGTLVDSSTVFTEDLTIYASWTKTGEDQPDDPSVIVINSMAGYNGMTVVGDDSVDENGQVYNAWIAMNFTPWDDLNFDILMSNEHNAFAIKVGDGRIIPANDPRVIHKTTSSVIIQFTMNSPYPSNSPCQLVFRTNKAWIRFVKRETTEEEGTN